MSYELRVENVTPTAHLFRDLGASYRPIRYPNVTAWLGWRGRAARGVTLTEYEGHTLVKLRGYSSPDDLALGVELIAGLARAQGKPVWVEDVPPGVEYDEEKAPTSQLSPSLFAFAPDALHRWPAGWFEYQTYAAQAGLRSDVTATSASLVSTPGRAAVLSRALLQSLGAEGFPAPRFLLFGQRRRPLSLSFIPMGAAPIDEYLQWAHPLLMLPVRPRFIEPGLPVTERRCGPPPSSLVDEPPFLTGDFSQSEEGEPRPSFVTLVPGVRHLVSRASYVAVQRGSTWSLVPFAAFLVAAASSLVLVDEFTWAFDAPDGRGWTDLWAPLLARAVKEVPDDSQYREDARDLFVQQNLKHLQGAPENDLLNALFQARTDGRLDEALAVAAELRVVAPDRCDGHYWASRLHLERGDAQAALAELRLAVRVPHPVAGLRAGMLGDLAEQLFNAGELVPAQEAIARALAVAPLDWPSREGALTFQQRLAAAAVAGGSPA